MEWNSTPDVQRHVFEAAGANTIVCGLHCFTTKFIVAFRPRSFKLFFTKYMDNINVASFPLFVSCMWTTSKFLQYPPQSPPP
jgi:hypothetical protein